MAPAAFYGPPNDSLANLKMLARFYEANPDYVDKTFLMVKVSAGTAYTHSHPLTQHAPCRRAA